MRKFITILTGIALTFAMAGPAMGGPTIIVLPGLYNTGVDDNGVRRTDGALEIHYELTFVPDDDPGAAIVIDPLLYDVTDTAWVGAPDDAQWIGPTGGDTTDPAGWYHYDLTLNVPTSAAPWLVISGNWTPTMTREQTTVFSLTSGWELSLHTAAHMVM